MSDSLLTVCLDFALPERLPKAMPTNSLSNLTSQQLYRAAALRERIEALEQELTRVLGVSTEPTVAVAPDPVAKKTKRRFSAATRAKMAAAMKARWAARKAAAAPVARAPAPVKKVKKVFSAAARAKLAAATKARWKNIKAAGKKSL